MMALKKWLEGESKKLEMPLVQKEMLRETTLCGWIFNKNFPFSTAQCITKHLGIYMSMHGNAKHFGLKVIQEVGQYLEDLLG